MNALSDHNAIYISIKIKIIGKQNNLNPTKEKIYYRSEEVQSKYKMHL